MKPYFLVVGLSIFGATMIPNLLAVESDGAVNRQFMQAVESKDVNLVIDALPAIEKLWPQEPKSYFASVRKAAEVLGAATTNDGAKSALAHLLSNLAEKPFPGTPEADVLCLEGKKDAILYFLNFNDVRDDKTNLLAIAKCVGKIREQIVPDFVPKTIFKNPPGLMDATPEQAKKIIRENEQNKAINYFQQTLHSADGVLVFHLLHNAAGFSAGNPANADFIRQISKLAHLTAEEQRQLQP